MTDFIRRLVSGNKARFKDGDLDVELDLAYITDNVIVMGYPASGLEGLYRNRREDAKKFLEHRHGKNFWVFNFCPAKENTYPASVFDGRVSRYPFPDHHAPPLAVLPLIAREMRAWLEGSPDRVAVLHCKAGKGRSGTMACTYLLTLDIAPSRPNVEQSRTKSESAMKRAEELMDTMPADDSPEAQLLVNGGSDEPAKQNLSNETDAPVTEANPAKSSATNSLSHVLDLHTRGRMRRPSSPNKVVKPGVSIPSQRRWLYYWSLLLAHQGPPGFWSLSPANSSKPSPKVRLIQIKLRMRELSGMKSNLVRVANAVLDRTNLGKASGMPATSMSQGQVWISLARYDDELVDVLEKWEKRTRSDDGDMGKRKKGSEHTEDEDLADVFRDNKWDKGKMVRSFARLGTAVDDSTREDKDNDEKIITHILRPLTGNRWESLLEDLEQEKDTSTKGGFASEEPSLYDVTKTLDSTNDVVVNANREIRAKLYMGQVFMGWFWFIPTFHMPHPRSSAPQKATLVLTRKEIDFPLGIGSNIIDLEVAMEWCSESTDVIAPPDRQTSIDSREGKGEPAGIAATVAAIAAGNVGDAVEAKQAAED